jgi:hypothetical protein
VPGSQQADFAPHGCFGFELQPAVLGSDPELELGVLRLAIRLLKWIAGRHSPQ